MVNETCDMMRLSLGYPEVLTAVGGTADPGAEAVREGSWRVTYSATLGTPSASMNSMYWPGGPIVLLGGVAQLVDPTPGLH